MLGEPPHCEVYAWPDIVRGEKRFTVRSLSELIDTTGTLAEVDTTTVFLALLQPPMKLQRVTVIPYAFPGERILLGTEKGIITE